MASRLCVAAVLDLDGQIVRASVCDASPDAEMVVGSAAEIDAIVAAAAPRATVVTWGGHRWLHRLGPAGKARYETQSDLEALFVAEHAFSIRQGALQCVVSTGDYNAASVASIVQTIERQGRLVWDRAAGGSRGFWTPDFFVPLCELLPVTAPAWVETPVVIERPADVLEGT